MSDNLRDRIAKLLYNQNAIEDGDGVMAWDEIGVNYQNCWYRNADAVMEMLTTHIPPIVASAIHSYADSEIMAMSYHGDPSGLAALKKLNNEAAQIANYATTHERWNGAK